MPTPAKELVTINFITGNRYPPVMGFNFREFAILLTYDDHEGSNFSTYYGTEYRNYALAVGKELRNFPKEKRSYFTFNLQIMGIKEIKEAFQNHKHVSYLALFATLEKWMPRDILPQFYHTKRE